uniref:MIF4G domain-containing protein n=1 Tax=Chromera velia CCMP2878 TaxID=1169474 RepID=A0A0G4FV37_9ALVE|eukprot:Cvel_18935.t1-p1 / transcript=Cvel_18935.t1 / gene=Cvel_18935 / organism=Chromera_velia_CCMP2878 / gene_product=Eukaryotic translation initiation factor isoform, putative / transcript_product=Eukaryotic translation initiation factor isoform, putative / location=Cvel_scaffold1598:11157-15280(+) / protein_length=585 / sequence_SO=supercontig / SO=protein_coding / is_pseudo=false
MLTFSASRAAASGHIGGGMVTVSEWTLQQRRERTQGDEKTRTLRAARALLNKFTTSNFEDCYKQLIELHYQEGHTVRELVKMIFDMATTQILFQKVYAELCKRLAVEMEAESFLKLLLAECEEAFDSYLHLGKEEAGQLSKIKKDRMMGNIHFVGCLLLRQVLSVQILRSILVRLVDASDRVETALVAEETADPSCTSSASSGIHSSQTEVLLEGLYAFTKSAGKRLDEQPELKEQSEALFERVTAYAEGTRRSSARIRLLMKDIVELRAQDWRPKVLGGHQPPAPPPQRGASSGGVGGGPGRGLVPGSNLGLCSPHSMPDLQAASTTRVVQTTTTKTETGQTTTTVTTTRVWVAVRKGDGSNPSSPLPSGPSCGPCGVPPRAPPAVGGTGTLAVQPPSSARRRLAPSPSLGIIPEAEQVKDEVPEVVVQTQEPKGEERTGEEEQKRETPEREPSEGPNREVPPPPGGPSSCSSGGGPPASEATAAPLPGGRPIGPLPGGAFSMGVHGVGVETDRGGTGRGRDDLQAPESVLGDSAGDTTASSAGVMNTDGLCPEGRLTHQVLLQSRQLQPEAGDSRGTPREGGD